MSPEGMLALRRELEALRERHGADLFELADALAALMLEDATVAHLEADEVAPSSPGIARAMRDAARRLEAGAAAIAAMRRQSA